MGPAFLILGTYLAIRAETGIRISRKGTNRVMRARKSLCIIKQVTNGVMRARHGQRTVKQVTNGSYAWPKKPAHHQKSNE